MIGDSECEWDSLTEELGQDGLAVLFLQKTVYFPLIIIYFTFILKIRFIF